MKKSYKLLKELPGILVGTIKEVEQKEVVYQYFDGSETEIGWTRYFIDDLLKNGFIEEVKEDKVEEFIKKIYDDKSDYWDTKLKNNIKDNGKEEVKEQLQYCSKLAGGLLKDDKATINEFLEKYIIIKI